MPRVAWHRKPPALRVVVILMRPDYEGHRSCSDAEYRSIADLFAGYAGDYQSSETARGDDVGAERLP